METEYEFEVKCTSEERSFKREGKKGVATASCTTNQTFFLSESGMYWMTKASVVTKRKACNIVSNNLDLQNDKQNVHQFQKHGNYLSVFQVKNRKKTGRILCPKN